MRSYAVDDGHSFACAPQHILCNVARVVFVHVAAPILLALSSLHAALCVKVCPACAQLLWMHQMPGKRAVLDFAGFTLASAQDLRFQRHCSSCHCIYPTSIAYLCVTSLVVAVLCFPVPSLASAAGPQPVNSCVTSDRAMHCCYMLYCYQRCSGAQCRMKPSVVSL